MSPVREWDINSNFMEDNSVMGVIKENTAGKVLKNSIPSSV